MHPFDLPMTFARRCAGWLMRGMVAAVCVAAQLAAHAAAPDAPPAAAACLACHGSQGEGRVTGTPRLAGQNSHYLEHALSAFRAGTRTSPVMQPVAAGLSDAQIHDLSAYFAGLHAPRVAQTPAPPPALVLAGEQLAQVGAPTDPTPPCLSCHASAGQGGNPHFPGLAGQPTAYIVSRLHEFQARARAKPPEPATMTAAAAQLDEMQIRQVAAYLSTLPPS